MTAMSYWLTMGAAVVARAVACRVWLHIAGDLLDSTAAAGALDLLDKAARHDLGGERPIRQASSSSVKMGYLFGIDFRQSRESNSPP